MGASSVGGVTVIVMGMLGGPWKIVADASFGRFMALGCFTGSFETIVDLKPESVYSAMSLVEDLEAGLISNPSRANFRSSSKDESKLRVVAGGGLSGLNRYSHESFQEPDISPTFLLYSALRSRIGLDFECRDRRICDILGL